ncbi:MAG: cytochrome P450 [Bryobacteraceae bacterium]
MSRPIPVAVLGPRLETEPGPLMAEMYARYGPVFRAARIPVVFFVGPEANQFLLGTHRHLFSNGAGWQQLQRAAEVFGEGLVFSDGPSHDLHRRLMNPPFRIHCVEAWSEIVNRVIAQSIGGWGARGEIDLFPEAYRIMFAIASEAFLGMSDPQEVRELGDLFLELESFATRSMPPEERAARERRISARIAELVMPHVQARRGESPRDVLGLIASARDEKGFLLDDKAVLAEATTLLLAGHITTTSFACWMFYLLWQNPLWQDRVCIDPAAMERVLLEVERLYPPIAHMPRVTLEEFEFAGYRIPKGILVGGSIIGSHWIPEVFAEPARFDPDRFAPPRQEHIKTPYSLIGFAGGPRMCLGVHFARFELAALARQVLTRYRLSLAPGFAVTQRYRPLGTPVPGMRMRVEEFTS